MLGATGHAIVAVTLALALTAGCGGADTHDLFATNDDGGAPPSADVVRGGGTQNASPSRPTAILAGRVDLTASASIRLTVNGDARDVAVAPDGTFVVGNVPTGDLTIGCDVDGHTAAATVANVQPAETIAIEIHVGSGVTLSVGDRTPPSAPPVACSSPSGAPLEVQGNGVEVIFGSGQVTRNVVVLGDDVTLVGGSDACGATRTTFTGSLTVHGKRCKVVGIELRGDVTITTGDAHVLDACSGCYNDACSCAHGACGSQKGHGAPKGHGRSGKDDDHEGEED